MPAPAEIVQLVELFQRNYDQYCAPSFSEAAVRHQFIDPFFAALGWDVNNTQGFAEQYKEVVHEDKVLVGDATKAPDYSFRIGKERKFFVEAKKPSVNIKHDIEPAYQLRRYAWSAKLPLSILTDFEEFSVYDCRMRPDRSDKAATGRILLLNFTDYVARWDEIAGIFSKAAVWQGALDRFAVAKAGKRTLAKQTFAIGDRPHRLPAHLRGAQPGDVRATARAAQRRPHLRALVGALPSRGPALQLRAVPFQRGAGSCRSA